MNFNWTIIFIIMSVLSLLAYIPTRDLQFTIIGLQFMILAVLLDDK